TSSTPSATSGTPTTTSSPTGETASQVVDEYLRSLSTADYDRAYLLQAKQARDQISVEDFREINRLAREKMSIASQSWELISETPSGSAMLVETNIITSYQTGNSVTKRALYTVVREDGAWRVDRVEEIRPPTP
ncbi:MAG: hypothetical protein NTU59_02315, partial [Coprothermobacterota bacterium]|nr:hypothetical protein [Coprothermobacterota bacterium]